MAGEPLNKMSHRQDARVAGIKRRLNSNRKYPAFLASWRFKRT
jgi:hypothetical protein